MLDLDRATDKAAAEKIRRATVDLLFRSPLFGLMLLGSAIRVLEQKGVGTMCTDGRRIFYDPEWVHRKELPSVMFDLLHEGLHIFGNHPARTGNRDKRAWGYAIDVRVAHDGLAICRARGPWELDTDHIPAHAWAKDMSAEEIYDKIAKDPEKHIPKDYESDIVPQGVPMTASEDAEFKRKLTEDLSQAFVAEEQQNKGKDLDKVYNTQIHERLKELKRCEVPWNVLLQGRVAESLGNTQATWSPPNRKWMSQGIALPSMRGSAEKELLLGIDVSGSIGDEDIKRFRACILPAARRAKKTTIVTFDQQLREVKSSTRPETLFQDIKFRTGAHSHTDARCVFEEVDARRPSAVAIITDGYIQLPANAYPSTHWILTPTGKQLPWGRHYRMHYAW